jgi:hypothetical protein
MCALHAREEVVILIRCGVLEWHLRQFLEVVVRATIYRPADPRDRPSRGAVWLAGDRLEDRSWEHISSLLDATGDLSRSWAGVWWEGREGMAGRNGEIDRNVFYWEQRGVVSCEFQRDIGYDWVALRLNVPEDAVELILQTAAALNGGATSG